MSTHLIYDPKNPEATAQVARNLNELAKTAKVLKSAVIVVPASSPESLSGVPLTVLAKVFRGKLPRGRVKASQAVYDQIRRRPGVTARLEELALEGKPPKEAVDRVRSEFPRSKASKSDYYIARSNLRKRGLIE